MTNQDASFSSATEDEHFEDCQFEDCSSEVEDEMVAIEFTTPVQKTPKRMSLEYSPVNSKGMNGATKGYHNLEHSDSGEDELQLSSSLCGGNYLENQPPCLYVEANCTRSISSVLEPAPFPLNLNLTVDGNKFFELLLQEAPHLKVMWIMEKVMVNQKDKICQNPNPLALKNVVTGSIHTLMDELDPKEASMGRFHAMFYSTLKTSRKPPQFYTPRANCRGSPSRSELGSGTSEGGSPRENSSVRSSSLSSIMPSDAMTILQLAPMTAMPNSMDNNFFNTWAEPEASSFQVRGLNYKIDGKKIPSQESAYILLGVELLKNTSQYKHVSARPGSFVERYQRSAKENTPFIFVLNFVLPFANFLAYFCPRTLGRSPYVGDEKFDRLLKDYIEGDKDFRDRRMKIIPRCVEGPWVVQTAVGQKPAIMGTKIRHNYYSFDHYFELEVDILSSRAAGAILGAVKNFTSSVAIDLAFVLQGENQDELPERILGALRFYRIDVQGAVETEVWEQR